MSFLFPIGSEWHWGTFVLYCTVAMVVACLCRLGAKYDERCRTEPPFASKSKNKSVICYGSAVIILTLLGSLRSQWTGSDTYVYVDRFLNASGVAIDWNLFFQFQVQEPGFQLYMYLIRVFTDNYTVFFAITYFLIGSVYILYIRYFFHDKSDFIFLQIFIFYFVHNMSSMRSALGAMFLLLSFIALDKRQYKTACILTLVATMFHYTMLYNFYIIVLMWLLQKEKLPAKISWMVDRWWAWVLCVGAVAVLAYLGTDIMYRILDKLKYGYYLPDPGELSFLGSMIYVVFGFFALLFLKPIMRENGKPATALLISLGMLLTYPVIYITAAYRIPYYYVLPRLTVWSKCTDYVEEKIQHNRMLNIAFKIILEVIVIMYLLFRFTRMANDGHFAYVLK